MNNILNYIIVLCVLFISCTNHEPQLYPLYIQDKLFEVELAVTLEERQRGLMYRKDIAENYGMLFIFSDRQIRSFWMRNTYIDLSIAYIDTDGTIIDIFNMDALDETPVRSTKPVQYALEVKKGTLQGIYPGTKIDFNTIPISTYY